jgi:hypothetical protein
MTAVLRDGDGSDDVQLAVLDYIILVFIMITCSSCNLSPRTTADSNEDGDS